VVLQRKQAAAQSLLDAAKDRQLQSDLKEKDLAIAAANQKAAEASEPKV
jgi:hypothetical protein